MKININGITREMTPEEEALYNRMLAGEESESELPPEAEEEAVIDE